MARAHAVSVGRRGSDGTLLFSFRLETRRLSEGPSFYEQMTLP